MGRTTYRLAAGTLFAGGVWLGLALATGDAAHADTPPAVTIERPAVLDRAVKLPHRLPQQASARAKAVTAKVTAEPTPPAPAEPTPAPAEPTPAPSEDQADEPTPAEPTEPEPAPSDEPTPPADETPVELPPVEVPLPTPTPTEPLPAPVEPPPVEAPLPLPPVELPPLPAPPVELPPPPQPAPLPAAPADLPVVAVVVPVAPPVAAVPAPAPPPAGAVAQLIADLTAGTEQPECADSPDDARHIDRDALRRLLAGLDHEPPPAVAQKPAAPGCPGTPDLGTPGAVQVKPPPPSAAEIVVGDLARSHVPPALARLQHTRARSHLPAGRSPHIEPGPA